MYFLDNRLFFPDPDHAPSHGLLAIGGDLSIDRLLLAYRSGIFPWYNDGEPICWYSPDPRMVFDLHLEQPMRVTKSLRQSIRNKGYVVKENTCFEQVINQCSKVQRKDQLGTWINHDMIDAYTALFTSGYAHSIEVFIEDELVGGLYGVDLKHKGVFCGESMFSLVSDASKIALLYLVEKCKKANYRYIDAQVYNDHLASLGAIEIPRSDFIQYLATRNYNL